MSFLTRTINASRTAAIATPASRIAAARTSRTFTTSLAAQKTASETVKDELKHIDRVVSDKLVDGINIASMSNLFSFLFQKSYYNSHIFPHVTLANHCSFFVIQQPPHQKKSRKQPKTFPTAVSLSR